MIILLNIIQIKKLPGVGISIGLSRLFYQLNELNALSSSKKSISDVLVVSADSDISVCLPVATELRKIILILKSIWKIKIKSKIQIC